MTVCLNPKCNASTHLFKVFQDQLSTSGPIEGEDDGAEGPQQSAKPTCNASLHVAPIDGAAFQRSNHCTIGRDEGRIRSQAQSFEERSRVGDAPAGGDGYGDSGLLRGSEGTGIAGADRPACRWPAACRPCRLPPGELEGALV